MLEPSRRSVLAGTGALLLAGCVSTKAGLSDPIVETAQGRYRGANTGGVQVFKGMRYGADTGGRNRFMPPQPAPKFASVREALRYGDSTPQVRTDFTKLDAISEDCLRINVWTPAADTQKRPVLLWFHGGGFEAGNGSSDVYDGTRMALRGDVVVCTINHRLNVFGFCDLSAVTASGYEQSGNVGYLDLVASMKWVRENIAAFGGDPNNIMIYGQSGGGRKVSVCFAGAEANGLFQKGIVQSGSHNKVQTREQSAALTGELLSALEISPNDPLKLLEVPEAVLTATQRKVIGKLGYRFEPNIDGISFTEHPFIPNAPKLTARVPMMLGTTRTELSNQLGRDEAIYDMTETEMLTRIARFFPPEDVSSLVSVFKKSNPSANSTELYFLMTSWRSYVQNATVMAEARAEMNGGDNPTWMYNVTWKSPAEGGRRYSQHTLDLPFMFDNVDRALHLTGPESEETRYMAEAMSEAWLAFARTGDPNHKMIPRWSPYGLNTRNVMHFDVPAEQVSDPFREEREFMRRYSSVRQTARRN